VGRKRKTVKPLDTIWEIPDELWSRIEPILLEDAPWPPTEKGGRKRADWRQTFDGIVFLHEDRMPVESSSQSLATTARFTAGFNGGTRTV
jgi:hypothetical protein